ncbi:uncharacterized protein A4U43_C05F20520 [Asparagus officinalis]|uniref:Uncharacterized protein n=1 Tax=Asparagus officinalis TaxID=4686 RepID=A0A5P1EU68_ASPOF|nr:uncharacterized protein A4U43_C05F20520 [Asparagus officinalis]
MDETAEDSVPIRANYRQANEDDTGYNPLNLLVEVAANLHHQILTNFEAETYGVHAQNSQKHGGVSSHSNESNLVFPKLLIQLTEEEKEEDFMVFIGSKLPQRPKKRAKLIQRKIDLMVPGSWISGLTLKRYEIQDGLTKQRIGGLKGMGDLECNSD